MGRGLLVVIWGSEEDLVAVVLGEPRLEGGGAQRDHARAARPLLAHLGGAHVAHAGLGAVAVVYVEVDDGHALDLVRFGSGSGLGLG